MAGENQKTRWLETLDSKDVPLVGGKNAFLGELIQSLKGEGIRVPDGFATTSQAYREFLEANQLTEKIRELIKDWEEEKKSLEKAGRAIRALFLKSNLPEKIAGEIREAYRELNRRHGEEETDVAVRGCAIAEDLSGVSFAGQQETFLNIRGEEELLEACRKCYASLFTNRAIAYRREQGLDQMKVGLSLGVQKMVRSDRGSAGIMYCRDMETGFPDVVVINAVWGLGENVVQGTVTPDEYMVFKPLLKKREFRPIIDKNLGEKQKKMIYSKDGSRTTRNIDTPKEERCSYALEDESVLQLARWAQSIERLFGKPMVMEWARDGETGELFIVQARPQTVQFQKEAGRMKLYVLKEYGKRLISGLSIGPAIAVGKVCLIKSIEQTDRFEKGSILVTEMTDPDWVPIMKQAAGIVTDHGGRNSHAAIVSRELGIPAVVGTGEATQTLQNGQGITLSCAEGNEGNVYEGILDYSEEDVDLSKIPATQTQIMLNIPSPPAAFRWWQLPCEGIGLARTESIIHSIIKVHPMALVKYEELEDEETKNKIQELTPGYGDKSQYFVDFLSLGIAKIAASQYPHPAIVRMSDFKAHAYANLIGGKSFEPREDNPILGFRGPSRYYSDRYGEGFALECRAIKRVREEIGLTNVMVMIPFCRTLEEADRVLEMLGQNGLQRGEKQLQVYLMAGIPSNFILAEEFAERFDGFSIDSDDLTQLVLGVDRDSAELAHLFDERNEAVKRTMSHLIDLAHRSGSKVGICGQAPSDDPDLVAFLVEAGIDSISLNPDSVIEVKKQVAKFENRLPSRFSRVWKKIFSRTQELLPRH